MRFLKYGFFAVVLVAFGASGAWAWGDTGNCLDCHQDFGGFGEATHDLHNTFVEDCGYCHVVNGDTPLTGESRNDANNSCSGCHTGGGTAQHHVTTGADGCGCHNNTSNWPRGTEDFEPPYYDNAAATTLRFSCFDNIDNDGDDLYDADDSDCDGVPTENRSWTVIKDYYGTE
jgi:hypothetical protein